MNKVAFILPAVFTIFCCLIVVVSLGGELSGISSADLRSYLLTLGVFKSSIVFLAIYTFSVRPFVPVPPSLYTIAGGMTFGPLFGTVLSVTGATLNASLTFSIARYAGRGVTEKVFKKQTDKINGILQNRGFTTLLLLRSIPAGPPFDLVSYAAGLLRISFASHFLATLTGIVPVTMIFSYFGSSVLDGTYYAVSASAAVILILSAVPWYFRKKLITKKMNKTV